MEIGTMLFRGSGRAARAGYWDGEDVDWIGESYSRISKTVEGCGC